MKKVLAGVGNLGIATLEIMFDWVVKYAWVIIMLFTGLVIAGLLWIGIQDQTVALASIMLSLGIVLVIAWGKLNGGPWVSKESIQERVGKDFSNGLEIPQ